MPHSRQIQLMAGVSLLTILPVSSKDKNQSYPLRASLPQRIKTGFSLHFCKFTV
jgi:hypothetical protein